MAKPNIQATNVVDNNYNITLFIVIVSIIAIFGLILAIISIPFSIGVIGYWKNLEFDYKKYIFYLAKCASYRRIFIFFTFVNYTLKILSILTTFFLIYCLFKDQITPAMMVISALCDGLSLLFPFQKYVDTFSFCNIKMEKAILNCNKLTSNDYLVIYTILNNAYIECEDYIHIDQKV